MWLLIPEVCRKFTPLTIIPVNNLAIRYRLSQFISYEQVFINILVIILLPVVVVFIHFEYAEYIQIDRNANGDFSQYE